MTAAKDQETLVLNPAQDSQTQPEIVFLSSDLYSNEPPLETDLHRLQIRPDVAALGCFGEVAQ